MAEWTLSAALNRALIDAMEDDPRLLVYGEDVGRLGGVFRVTDGLQAKFGEERVFDTPIAEAGIVGAAIGLALTGWKSVVEMLPVDEVQRTGDLDVDPSTVAQGLRRISVKESVRRLDDRRIRKIGVENGVGVGSR